MNIFSWFLKKKVVPEDDHITVITEPGALPDPRPAEEKAQDYEAREIAMFAPVVWYEKKPSEWRSFPIRDQDGSSSCVGHGVAKALGIENLNEEGWFAELSPRDVYTRRANPGEGMWLPDAMEIASKHGCTLEYLMPSNKKNEVQMNDKSDYAVSKDQIALVFKAKNYVQFNAPYSIDEIASIVDRQRKGIVICFRFDYDEWTNKPKRKSTSNLSLGHCVTVVDYTLDGSDKCLVVEDSWGAKTAINGRRLITEDFLKNRCFFAGYFVDLNNNWRDAAQKPPRPKVQFGKDLKFGMQDPQVAMLQDVLKYEELFPVEQPSTGYYGAITAKGVLAWQLRYNIDGVRADLMGTPIELTALGGKVFGPKSRARANELYK